MAAKRKSKSDDYTRVSELKLRSPRSDCRMDTAEAWLAGILDVPPVSVRLVLPTGRKARADKTLGAFRADWGW